MSKPLGKPDRIVVALGGNALGNTPEEQIEKVAHAAHALLGLIEQGNATRCSASSSRATRSSSPTATARRSA